MDKVPTRNEQKVKNNATYQRDMERSFAVIYHNLRRIQDGKQGQEQSMRRRHSEPQTRAPNPALLTNYEQSFERNRSNTVSSTSPNPRVYKRRVSFSDVVSHSFIPESNGSRMNNQVCNFSQQGKDQETTSHLPF